MKITFNGLLFAVSRALDFVEREMLGVSSNHGKRVAYVSMRLCQAMGGTQTQVFDMASCAVLHDNALTAYMLERGEAGVSGLEGLEIHCAIGEKNAEDFPFMEDASGIILHHHENWNGGGYHKLAGNAIPLRSAILRLADNTDLHLGMGRPRTSLVQEIREHALRHKGTLYSPLVVEALLDSLDDEFVRHVSDANIDRALELTVPTVGRDLSTTELLRICRVFALIIDAKSPFTRSHSQGVAETAAFLGRLYGFDQEHCDKLAIAAYLHDIGKLSTPLSILNKPGSLNAEELEIMRQHVIRSQEILQDVQGLEDIALWGAQHHERLDGSGYPHGVRGEDMPFESRLMACCDIYQALMEDRPYCGGMRHADALGLMRTMAKNGELDADIVECIGRELAALHF